eukprot:3473624-Amphidinium_carterae.1
MNFSARALRRARTCFKGPPHIMSVCALANDSLLNAQQPHKLKRSNAHIRFGASEIYISFVLLA